MVIIITIMDLYRFIGIYWILCVIFLLIMTIWYLVIIMILIDITIMDLLVIFLLHAKNDYSGME